MNLSSTSEAFILHFGEMGSRWGFNRTVGQLFALLVIHQEPLTAEQLSETLKVSRGNVSMGLKELQAWRLVKKQHHPGDRKEYFSTAGNEWELARTVFEERRKRELDPTLSLLRQHLLNQPQDEQERYAHQKMQNIYELLELLDFFANSLNGLSQEKLKALMKLGAGISKVLELKDKVIKKDSGNNQSSSS